MNIGQTDNFDIAIDVVDETCDEHCDLDACQLTKKNYICTSKLS